MNDMTRQRIVLQTPEMDETVVRRDVAYRDHEGAKLGLDIYSPPGPGDGPRPALLFVTGYPDDGFKRMTGCIMKEMGAYISWAELVASAGIVGITYENRDPVADAAAALGHVVASAPELGIDPARIGIWSASGNVPNALHLLCNSADAIACAALCYGYTMDLDDRGEVQSAALQFGFANPMGAGSVERLPDRPLLVVRAGKDEMPGINASIDGFVEAARERGVDLTLIDYADGAHAFDLTQDCDESRDVILGIVDFLRDRL